MSQSSYTPAFGIDVSEALLSGAMSDPFSVLGPHKNGRRWSVTALMPGAERVTGSQTVVERGISEVLNDDTDAVVDRYVAYHILQDGRWRTISMDVKQEQVDPLDWTEDMKPLVGKWEAAAKGWRLQMNFEWAAEGRFLKREFKVLEGETSQGSGVTVIGWDPLTQSVKSWSFSSAGGHGEGRWTREGDQWVIETKAVTPDGEVAKATNVITMLSPDEFRWQSINRSLAGAAIEDTDTIRVKRIK